MPHLPSKCKTLHFYTRSNAVFLAGRSLLETRFLHKGSLKYPLRDNLLKVKRGKLAAIQSTVRSIVFLDVVAAAVSLYILVIRGR